jgi:hypothetical protein
MLHGLIHQTQRMNCLAGLDKSSREASTIDWSNQEHDFHTSPGDASGVMRGCHTFPL